MKTADVTGASRGIGVGIVNKLLLEAWKVIADARNIEKIKQ